MESIQSSFISKKWVLFAGCGGDSSSRGLFGDEDPLFTTNGWDPLGDDVDGDDGSDTFCFDRLRPGGLIILWTITVFRLSLRNLFLNYLNLTQNAGRVRLNDCKKRLENTKEQHTERAAQAKLVWFASLHLWQILWQLCCTLPVDAFRLELESARWVSRRHCIYFSYVVSPRNSI